MDSHLSVSSGIFTDFESSVFVYAITCLISFRRKLMQSRIICQREPLLPLAQMGGFYVPLLILEAGFPRAPGSGGGGPLLYHGKEEKVSEGCLSVP